MVSCVLLVLGSLWIQCVTQTCRAEELSREQVLVWFRERVLQGLGLEKPPVLPAQGPSRGMAWDDLRERHRRSLRTSSTALVNHHHSPTEETALIILFPASDSSCPTSDSAPGETTPNHFTYYFQPSMKNRETLVTLAHFWFYAGEGFSVNSSLPLLMLTSEPQLLQAAEAPSKTSSDGWVTYHLKQNLRDSMSQGPFVLQVHCAACQCHADEPDKMPFVHLRAQPRGPARSPRRATTIIPWSPSAINLLQRPSLERPQHSDCHRAEVNISFEELGWDNWIVHPKVLTFYYCNGNCSAWDRTTAILGITQCCAPVPGTMKSIRITTTSDGGYSFKYETLPNIIPEDCTCI
ncbi:inhibin alpha chain [Thalassophryne amazonica]|uniref:inhibin alpha chain n=1 Tax=Thalassophryne amazonica TaxID=390379 RepID=UPI001471FA02|nr:inhibin alpha chain [Thalassophryne amazonica]